MKVAVIYSGGMDSYTLLQHAAIKFGTDEVMALSFDYGQRHRRELDCTRKVCRDLDILHRVIPFDAAHLRSALTDITETQVPEGHYAAENMKQTVVPGRNMIMLSMAVGIAESAGASAVWFGAHAGDHTIYPDCRPDFVKAFCKAAQLGTWARISVEAPFVNMTKGEILHFGLERLGLYPLEYEDTWTCYNGGDKPCGRCGSCTERLEAFEFAGATDPLEYEEPING